MRKKSKTPTNPSSLTPLSQEQPAVDYKVSKPTRSSPPASEAAIRLYAYVKWEAAGRPEGDGMEFWLEAE